MTRYEKTGFVKLATAKSMKIGELVYHNPVFLVSWLRLRARYNCDRSCCKIPDFTLPKLGIIPDFVL